MMNLPTKLYLETVRPIVLTALGMNLIGMAQAPVRKTLKPARVQPSMWLARCKDVIVKPAPEQAMLPIR
jgi:hypothetical protein